MGWDCQQVEQNGERQALCVELVLGKWAILCTSLSPADVFLGLCSVPLHLLLLIKDFAQHSWRLCPELTTFYCERWREKLALSHGIECPQAWSTASCG